MHYETYMQDSEKILDVARELYKAWEISEEKLIETYFHRFYLPNRMGVFLT